MKSWYHLKENHFCGNICPKSLISGGFKLWERSGISGVLYDFDIYQGKANKGPTADKTSDVGISSSVVVDLYLALPDDHNFKVFADNFYTILPLIMELNKCNIFYVGTIRLPRMKIWPLLAEKDLKKNGRGAVDYQLDVDSNAIVVHWFDNKLVNLVSSFAGVEPTHSVTRYDQSQRKRSASHTAQHCVYNQYMGGVDKLDTMGMLYKPSLRTRRCYIYIWLHSILIAGKRLVSVPSD